MTTLDTVNKIKDDIAALPPAYRSLIVAEQTWASAHPVLYALALIGVGIAIAAGVVLFVVL